MKTEKNKAHDPLGEKLRQSEKLWDLRKACWANACDLMKEATLLFQNECYARSYSLAYTAMEEIGKYILVCDFITGVASHKELKEAFHNHHIKAAYFHNNVKFNASKDGVLGNNDLTVVYDKVKYKELFEMRNSATYVNYTDEFVTSTPADIVTKELAESIIDHVTKEINFIIYAEDLNGRIGSKALYK